jgi:hypothetical protein
VAAQVTMAQLALVALPRVRLMAGLAVAVPVVGVALVMALLEVRVVRAETITILAVAAGALPDKVAR